jgi:hypothetical protein
MRAWIGFAVLTSCAAPTEPAPKLASPAPAPAAAPTVVPAAATGAPVAATGVPAAAPTVAPAAVAGVPVAATGVPAAAPSGVPAAPTVVPAAAANAGPASCVDDGAPFEPEALRARVAELAAPALDGRATGAPGDAAARALLVARFRCLGLTPAGDAFEQPFAASGDPTANVVGYVAGTDPDAGIILVGAHHDHLGDGHLGANDDASGVAALLAIAQAVRQGPPPRRTIAFALFGAEEPGLVGSSFFAAHPPDALPLARIVYDVNLDMVGSYASTGAVYALGTFRGLPGTAAVRRLTPRGLHVVLGGRGEGSDHEAFCQAGIPYVFFWTPDRRCYHARCDTAERLDVPHLAQIAALAGGLVAELADSPLDLAASRARRGCR